MWYSAKLLFVSKVEGRPVEESLFEESIILVESDSLANARQNALKLAKDSEDGYKNDQGERVEWEFQKLIEIQDLCEESLYSGVEVFSTLYYRHNEIDEAERVEENP